MKVIHRPNLPARGAHCAQAIAILEALESAVVRLDRRRKVEYLNPAAEHLLHSSLRQAQGHALDGLLRPEGEERLEDLLSPGPSEGAVQYRRALSFRLPDHTLLVVDWIAHDLGGAGWLLELRSVESSLRRTEEALQERIYLAAQEMLRGLAHEIKNPLGGLRGATQLLQAELPAGELREYTEILLHEVDRLRALVDRLQGPRGTPEWQRVNIHQILEHCRRLLQTDLAPGVRLRFDYDVSLPELWADPGQLVQVFLNILRNAQQALRGHGTILLRTRVERYVTLVQRLHRLVLRVDVVDDGPGIPEEIQPRIFLPLVTTRPEGAGMGLAIVQNLVRGHGGTVQCRSRPGETCFSVRLPMDGRSAR